MLNHWAFECQRVKALCDGIGPCCQAGLPYIAETRENVARLKCSKFLMLPMPQNCKCALRVETFEAVQGLVKQETPAILLHTTLLYIVKYMMSCES